MTLGNYIKECRQAHRFSIDDFARRSGMSKAYVSISERNYNPSAGKAAVLKAESPMYKPLAYWNEEMSTVRILGKTVAFTSTGR